MTPSIMPRHKKVPSITSRWGQLRNTSNSQRIRVCLAGEASSMCALIQVSQHTIRLHRQRIPCPPLLDSQYIRWEYLGKIVDPLGKGSGGTGTFSLSLQGMTMITVPIRSLTAVDTNGQPLELIDLRLLTTKDRRLSHQIPTTVSIDLPHAGQLSSRQMKSSRSPLS